MRSYYILIILFLVTSISLAQSQVTDLPLEQFIEDLVAIPSENIDYTQLYETLLQYQANPININQAPREELESLFILSNLQIDALLKHIKEQGALLNLHELQTIQYFDPETISRLRPFVKASPITVSLKKSLTKDLFSQNNNFLLLRYEQTLEQRRGFKHLIDQNDSLHQPAYQGSSGRINIRFRSQKANSYRLGFSAEKDAGEVLAWDVRDNRYGADSYHFYYQILDRGKLKNLTIGDYQLQFGQGLLLSGGFNLGKGAESITNVRRTTVGIRPHTSLQETGFFRGAAGTYSVYKIYTTIIL